MSAIHARDVRSTASADGSHRCSATCAATAAWLGSSLLALVLLFAGIGRLVWDIAQAAPLSGPANLESPSWDHPLGTDRQGRDLLAVMIVGTPKTLYIGLLAGIIGVTIGTTLALIAAYYGGAVDAIIRGIVDIGLTIPPLLVLILARRLAALGPDGQPDGPRRRLARLALSDPHHPLPGAVDQGARLHPGRAPLRRARRQDHLSRDHAQPPAVPRRHLRRHGLGRRSWPRSVWRSSVSARSRPTPSASPSTGSTTTPALLHGLWWWFLPPVHHHHPPLRRPLLHLGRSGRARQPADPANGVIDLPELVTPERPAVDDGCPVAAYAAQP